MRLSLTPAQEGLQAEVHDFLARHRPALEEIPDAFDARVAHLREWQRELHAARLIGLSWPVEFGGRGASRMDQILVTQELARAGAPEIIGSVGVDVVGPSLVAHGTAAQKRAYLPRILSAEDLWCQGFSEPDAGSDLASLKTRATERGDYFVLEGQKTWTSHAQHARWCAVLARTDPAAPPHRGISYLIVDLASPGVEIRPLVQVTGDPEFAEVFFTEVAVPKENLLGELNRGWPIAMHTLAHERGQYALGRQAVLRALFDRLVEEAGRVRRDGRPAIDVEEIRTAMARVHVGLEVLRHQCWRSESAAAANDGPGFEVSVDKVVLAQVEQQLCAVALDVLGPYATLDDGTPWGTAPSTWHHAYLYGRAASVYGGSAQIQRNIIAERILGLPRG